MIELIGSLFDPGRRRVPVLRRPRPRAHAGPFTRIQAGTKATTLGNILVMVGLAFYHPEWTLKLVLVIYFVLMTNPVSSHALSRAAHRIRTPMAPATVTDALADDEKAPKEGERGMIYRACALFAVILFAADLHPLGQQLCGAVGPSSPCGTLRHAGPRRTRCSEHRHRHPHHLSRLRYAGRSCRALHGCGQRRPASQEAMKATSGRPGGTRRRPASEIVATGSQVLLPVIFTFGAYVIVNGHLSAGGGFQGGAIVASGVMLMLLARPAVKLDAAALSMIESACRRAVCRDRHSWLDPGRRLPRSAVPAARRIRRLYQRRRHSADLGAAWHQSRGGAQRHHRPFQKLSGASAWQRPYRYPPSCWSQASDSSVIGLWGMLIHRHLLRIIIGFALIDTGLHIVIVCHRLCYRRHGPDHRPRARPGRGGTARDRSHSLRAWW